MTETIIINAVTPSAGYGVNPTKTTLQTTSTAFSVGVSATNGNSSGNAQSTIRVYIANCPFSITAAQAPSQLKKEAAILEVKPHESPNGTTIENSSLLARKGGYVYVWLEIPNVTYTITAILAEVN